MTTPKKYNIVILECKDEEIEKVSGKEFLIILKLLKNKAEKYKS